MTFAGVYSLTGLFLAHPTVPAFEFIIHQLVSHSDVHGSDRRICRIGSDWIRAFLKSNDNPKVNVYRACHEARVANSSLESGMYWIDPDGNGVGDGPIQVHCAT